MSASRCDRCGDVVADIEAGFSLGLHGYAHDCGGTWRVVAATDLIIDDETAADVLAALEEADAGEVLELSAEQVEAWAEGTLFGVVESQVLLDLDAARCRVAELEEQVGRARDGIAVTITRERLVELRACALDLFDAVAPSGVLHIAEWTQLHDAWLSLNTHAGWLIEHRLVPRPSLRGANLRGADLNAAHLRAADLTFANLRGANLCGANMRGANMTAANMRGANLCGAKMRGANMRDADLCGADLTAANMRAANMRDADLYGADLTAANMRAADLRSANLRGANLRAADMCGADLTGAELYGAMRGKSDAEVTGWAVVGGAMLPADD